MTKNFQHVKSGRSNEIIGAFQHTSKYYENTVTLGENMTRNTRKYKNVQKDYPYYPL